MIGVAASADDLRVAAEFFELFKTPWEPAVPAKKYRVVLSAGQPVDQLSGDVFVIYGSQPHPEDRCAGIVADSAAGLHLVQWQQHITLPIYGGAAFFDGHTGVLTHGGRALDCRYHGSRGCVRRVGYDLFDEVRTLLLDGQPAAQAATPSLDLHIAIFRELLIDAGVSFVEIPPRPDGYDFVCCLTHDVDFFGIRRHRLDRTLAGFAVRASIGTLRDAVRGRRPLTEAFRNWFAVLSLPLVFLRLMADWWNPFDDYASAEVAHRSTFFLIPFRDKPGTAPDGSVSTIRAVSYQASDIRSEANDVAARGHELAVHGIDAWRDVGAGRAELAELTPLSKDPSAGIRMHWLYFDHESPRRLEQAGFSYDSTCGYNEAVGYRAGTACVFRPLGVERLLELPMSIMDSAMFYPGRMGLTREAGLQQCEAIVENARRFGGTVVINWHDRSLAPERLWGWCYRRLVTEIEKGDRAWFATAGEAVEWFRWRRSIHFTSDSSGHVTITAQAAPDGLPAGRVIVHRPRAGHPPAVEEFRLASTVAAEVPL